MFDGASVASPGNFRNFEIHTEFQHFNTSTGVNQDFHFDTFFGGSTEQTDLFNITEGGSKAATAFPFSGNGFQPTLEVVTNDVVATPGNIVFDASNLSKVANGTVTGGNAFGFTYAWTLGGSPIASIEDPTFSISDLGLSNAADSATIVFAATELYTDFGSSNGATASYLNATPVINSASVTDNMDGTWTLSQSSDDADLAANALVSGFESITTSWKDDMGNVFLAGSGGTVTTLDLLNFFGGPGTFDLVTMVVDLAGAMSSQTFSVTIPEPAVASLLLLAGLGIAARRRSA